MGTQHIEVSRTIDAAPAQVWALLADVESWARWGPFEQAELESPGSSEREGVGAVRRFRRGRYTTRERVTAFEPGRRLGYDLISGIPIRDYSAVVTLDARDGGTALRWSSQFRPKIPLTGRLIRDGLAEFIATLVESLRVEAESQTQGRTR